MRDDACDDTAGGPAVARAFRESYPLFQYHFVEFFTSHLTDVSRAFKGDLQSAMILAVIGQRCLAAHMQAAPGTAPPPSRSSISASRLADVTGIPRETIRRKLKALEAFGWIERDGGSAWALVVRDDAAPAQSALAALDQRAIERAARLLSALKTFL